MPSSRRCTAPTDATASWTHATSSRRAWLHNVWPSPRPHPHLVEAPVPPSASPSAPSSAATILSVAAPTPTILDVIRRLGRADGGTRSHGGSPGLPLRAHAMGDNHAFVPAAVLVARARASAPALAAVSPHCKQPSL
eukprot:7391649-Prymnesium_polylepis.3